MRRYIWIVFALALLPTLLGCQFARDGIAVGWADMTLQEQLEVAEFGLQAAREAYWLYVEHMERRGIDPEPAQVETLEQRVLRYAELARQLRQALEPPEPPD